MNSAALRIELPNRIGSGACHAGVMNLMSSIQVRHRRRPRLDELDLRDEEIQEPDGGDDADIRDLFDDALGG